jgi:hypothetical protein
MDPLWNNSDFLDTWDEEQERHWQALVARLREVEDLVEDIDDMVHYFFQELGDDSDQAMYNEVQNFARNLPEYFAARSLPSVLGVEMQADIGAFLHGVIRHNGLPAFLEDVFYDNLPEALEFQDPAIRASHQATRYAETNDGPAPTDEAIQTDESGDASAEEDDYDDDRSRSHDFYLPHWFQASLIAREDPKPPQTPFFGLEIPEAAALNQVRDLASDLVSLLETVFDFNFGLFRLSQALVIQNTLDLYEQSCDDLHGIVLPDPTKITPDNIEILAGRCEELYGGLLLVEAVLAQNMNQVFHLEEALIERENELLANASTGLGGIFSRYERCRLRHELKTTIANFRTERLRQVVKLASNTQVPTTEARAHSVDEDCVICGEEFGEERGSIPAVTYGCCQRAYHAECLLSWMFEKIDRNEEMTCPMCRSKLQLRYLGELLEMHMAELDCL